MTEFVGILLWPEGWESTVPSKRVNGSFQVTKFERLTNGIEAQVSMFKGSGLRITCNVPLNKAYTAYRTFASAKERDECQKEPGVSIYFTRKGKPYVLAVDRYKTIEANMRAVELTLEIIRAIERYGSSGLMERSFQGFAELPAPSTVPAYNWWEILGVAPSASKATYESDYRTLVKRYHPDQGGDPETFLKIQNAIKQARGNAK